MCGIFGYVSRRELRDDAILLALSRRGPDGTGIVSLPLQSAGNELTCKLLHTRLSIIDLSTAAAQPMTDDTGDYTIIYNGEIFNFLELRSELVAFGYRFRTRSDTEVILAGYRHWGENVVTHLRGMFAFCIYDRQRQLLYLARDHFGMKPLYYVHSKDKSKDEFCFSSSIAALMQSGLQPSYKLCKDAIEQYLAVGSFLAPRTVLSDVHALLPGHLLVYENDEIHIHRYFNPSQSCRERKGDVAKLQDQLRAVMFDAVEKHLIADVPVGVFLSGGIDSSVIAGIAAKVSRKPILTFSVGFDGPAGWNDETAIASATAKKIGSIHQSIVLRQDNFDRAFDDFVVALDVPSIDGLNTYFISKAIGSRVKVVLSGVGGDEMFAGYPVFHDVFALQKVSRAVSYLKYLPGPALRLLGRSYLSDAGKSLFEIVAQRRLLVRDPDAFTYLKDYFHDNSDVLKAVSLFEIENYLANTLLRDMDAVTMHFSLESRAPFVDKEVFNFAMSVPGEHKIDVSVNKPMLVHSFEDLLVEETYRNPKRGFTLPIRQWIQETDESFETKSLVDLGVRFGLIPQEIASGERSGFARSLARGEDYRWLVLLKWIKVHVAVLSADGISA